MNEEQFRKQVSENEDTAIKLLKENVELKERKNKAIKYIKDYIYIDKETGEYCLTHTFDSSNLYELLKILGREDNV